MLVAAKVLQAAKYIKEWSNVHEPLKKRTYLGKKNFFNFLGADFLMPKSQHEKQHVWGPEEVPKKCKFVQTCWIGSNILTSNLAFNKV